MILITKTIKIELTDKERLIFACADGDLEEAKRLLSTGLNANTTDQYGHSLLWFACYRNQTEVARHLLSQPSIDLNQKDKNGQTAMSASLIDGQYQFTQLLLNDKRTDLSLCKDDFLQFTNKPDQNDLSSLVSIFTILSSVQSVKYFFSFFFSYFSLSFVSLKKKKKTRFTRQDENSAKVILQALLSIKQNNISTSLKKIE